MIVAQEELNSQLAANRLLALLEEPSKPALVVLNATEPPALDDRLQRD